MLCESLAAINLNLLHKVLSLWYKIVCSAFTVINYDFDTNFQARSRGRMTRGQSQGQGHKLNPTARPRTAFPKTDHLEAKDKNARGQGQGHSRKCFPKKKRSSKKFSGDLQFIGVTRIFDWGVQTTNYMQ